MGRTCRTCRRSRPNEQFGGRGRHAMICAKCRKRPKKERQRILAIEDVHGFLMQTNISAKNIKRIEELASIEDAEFQLLRTLVLEIAVAHPRKRRRWKALPQKHPVLFRQIVDSGFFDYLLDNHCLEFSLRDDVDFDDAHVSWDNVWLENEEP